MDPKGQHPKTTLMWGYLGAIWYKNIIMGESSAPSKNFDVPPISKKSGELAQFFAFIQNLASPRPDFGNGVAVAAVVVVV